ncbi:MAG: glycerophosphoryl diester phosphodiesterase membrane domain-containing protein [Patescibacteria group bacterium]
MQQLMPISDLMKKGWDFYTDNFQKFITPVIIMIIPYLVYYLALYFGNPSILILVLLLTVIMLAVNLWIAIVIIQLINAILKKQAYDLNKIFESSLKKIPSYLLVAILTGLILIGGFVLLIIPGIIFAVWYAFSAYTNILENKKGWEALKSSKELVQGRWGSTFWRLILPALAVYFVVMLVVIILMYLLTGGHIDSNSYSQSIMMNIVSSIIFIFLAPLFASFSLILYNNLKETKETPTPTQPTV